MSQSTIVQTALQRSDAISSWMKAHFPREVPASLKSHIAFAYFHLALEHRAAVITLVTTGALPSASALVRPVYEASTRGLWAVRAASDDQLRKLLEYMPKFETVMESLHKATKADQT